MEQAKNDKAGTVKNDKAGASREETIKRLTEELKSAQCIRPDQIIGAAWDAGSSHSAATPARKSYVKEGQDWNIGRRIMAERAAESHPATTPPDTANFVSDQLHDGPSCNLCGAAMEVSGFKCPSCGNQTGCSDESAARIANNESEVMPNETQSISTDTPGDASGQTREQLELRIAELETIIERDRTQVCDEVNKLKKIIRGREWLGEGRGPYEWDDDRWHDEFRATAAEIRGALEGLEKLAADLTNSPKTHEEVVKARERAESDLEAAKAELARFKALDQHLPPGFAIGDDATAELAIDLARAESGLEAQKVMAEQYLRWYEQGRDRVAKLTEENQALKEALGEVLRLTTQPPNGTARAYYQTNRQDVAEVVREALLKAKAQPDILRSKDVG